MTVEVDQEYIERVSDGAELILGACDELDGKVQELYGMLNVSDENREYIESVEGIAEAIRKAATTILEA